LCSQGPEFTGAYPKNRHPAQRNAKFKPFIVCEIRGRRALYRGSPTPAGKPSSRAADENGRGSASIPGDWGGDLKSSGAVCASAPKESKPNSVSFPGFGAQATHHQSLRGRVSLSFGGFVG